MKKKYLYCNGDSWTFGEEIGEDRMQQNINEKYYNTWPWLLSQELDIPVCINEASGGGSNDRIYRKTYQFIKDYIRKGKDPKELTIVIGWTSPERGEMGIEVSEMDIEYVRFTPHDIINQSKNLNKNTVDDLKIYRDNFLNLFSENYGVHNQLMFMDNLRFICSQLEISYYDFIAIGYWPPKMLENARYNKIKLPNFYSADTFNNTVQQNNWDVYPAKHPTPETYKKWTNILKKFII
jgi:hypothetical protein